MFLDIATFELRKRLHLLSTYVYFVIFLAAGFLSMIAAGGAFSGVSVGMGADKIAPNSPATLLGLTTALSLFALLVSAAVFGQAVHQDFESRIHGLFFTTPLRKGAYLAGRFVGALVFMTGVLSSIALGMWLGTWMPFVDHSLFVPNTLTRYVWPYVVAVLPNLFFTGAVFFTLGALTRRMVAVYTGSVVLVVGYLSASSLFNKMDNRGLAALVDPFGLNAQALLTRYWTVADKNALLIPLQGALLYNRLIWTAFGVLALGLAFVFFRFSQDGAAASGRAESEDLVAEVALPVAVPVQAPTGLGWLPTLGQLTWLNFQETVKSVYFLVITLAGALFMAVNAFQAGNLYETLTYPVTYAVLELVGGTFSVFLLILLTFYAGELVWRERDLDVDGLVDALPVPTVVLYLSKLFALLLVPTVLMGVVMMTGLGIQTIRGYHHYELGQYVVRLFGIELPGYLMLGVLAFSVQSLLQNKYIGHFVMVGYYVLLLFAGKLGVEHHLLRLLDTPTVTYSDMNGFGNFLPPFAWFSAYWGAFSVLLGVAAYLGWGRGRESALRSRSAVAKARWTAPVRWTAVAALGVFVAVGGFIYLNTNVWNVYRSSHDKEQARADYEKQYKALAKEPQPRITGIDLALDIDPARRTLRAHGTYTLLNRTKEPVKTVYVNLPEDQLDASVRVAGADKPTVANTRLGFFAYVLPTPLAPGATATLQLDLTFRTHGFKNEQDDLEIVENGTFFHSTGLLALGYLEASELSDDGARKKYGLPPKERMADVHDLEARRNTYISSDSDWIAFAATVSTTPDQIAIAPGHLEREWTENGRRYFRYTMDTPILNFFSVLSARYAVKKDTWNGVALEIDYQPGHTWDLDEMMRGMKAALEYCTTQYGPYPHHELRILEFPRYASYAQSFPNTIPYSERIGFIAKEDPTDDEDVHFPFFVTSHEVAHQWWAHQVIGGNVQGSTMLSETFAEYSALMIMKKEYSDHGMRRFLKHELDRYLNGRGFEKKKEVPLDRVENQPYIHYAKGSLVMYALQDAVGEKVVNRALSRFVKEKGFQQPPYTTSLEFLDVLRSELPPGREGLIQDLFETITLWDNRALTATSHAVDGGYEVRMKVSAKKVRAGELGQETEVPIDDLVDVGVLDAKGQSMALEKRHLGSGETEVTLKVAGLPVKAGIDPLNKLIDRRPDDNVVAVVHE